MVDALNFGGFVAEIALGLFEGYGRLIQASLQVDVDTLDVLNAFLQLPSSAVGLKRLKVKYETVKQMLS